MTDKKSCESCWHNRKHVSDFVGAVFAGQKEWLNQQRRSNEREQN